jgi:hypothetical protein
MVFSPSALAAPSRCALLHLVEVAPVGVERVIGFFGGPIVGGHLNQQPLGLQQENAKLACLSARSYQQSPPSSDHH